MISSLMTGTPIDMFTLAFFFIILPLMVLYGIIRVSLIVQGSKQPELPQYRIVKFWRHDLAKSWYKLEEVDAFNLGYIDTGYWGNFKWAQRTQKHYDCKIVKETDDN